ncbi:unnamed protein product [Diplocarpon coronariae]
MELHNVLEERDYIKLTKVAENIDIEMESRDTVAGKIGEAEKESVGAASTGIGEAEDHTSVLDGGVCMVSPHEDGGFGKSWPLKRRHRRRVEANWFSEEN